MAISMSISINPKPTIYMIYRNVYENTGLGNNRDQYARMD